MVEKQLDKFTKAGYVLGGIAFATFHYNIIDQIIISLDIKKYWMKK